MSASLTYSGTLLGFSGNHGALSAGGMRRGPGGTIEISTGIVTVRGLGAVWKLPASSDIVLSQFGPTFSIDGPSQGVRFFSSQPSRIAEALLANGFTIQTGINTKSGWLGIAITVIILFVLTSALGMVGNFLSFWLRFN